MAHIHQPWHIVRTDNKHRARLNPMRDIVFEFTPECLGDHRLVR
ncbi:MAG: hypothetical protein ABJA49_14465 [Betaproteobacteria bacterium]